MRNRSLSLKIEGSQEKYLPDYINGAAKVENAEPLLNLNLTGLPASSLLRLLSSYVNERKVVYFAPFFDVKSIEDMIKLQASWVDWYNKRVPDSFLQWHVAEESKRVTPRSFVAGWGELLPKLLKMWQPAKSDPEQRKARAIAAAEYLLDNSWLRNYKNSLRPCSEETAIEKMPKNTAALYPYYVKWRKYDEKGKIVEDNIPKYLSLYREGWENPELFSDMPYTAFIVNTGAAKAKGKMSGRIITGAPGALTLAGKRYSVPITNLVRGQDLFVSISSQKKTDDKVRLLLTEQLKRTGVYNQDFDATAWDVSQTYEMTQYGTGTVLKGLFGMDEWRRIQALLDSQTNGPIITPSGILTNRKQGQASGGPFTYIVNNFNNILMHVDMALTLGFDPNLIIRFSEFTGDDGELLLPEELQDESVRQDFYNFWNITISSEKPADRVGEAVYLSRAMKPTYKESKYPITRGGANAMLPHSTHEAVMHSVVVLAMLTNTYDSDNIEMWKEWVKIWIAADKLYGLGTKVPDGISGLIRKAGGMEQVKAKLGQSSWEGAGRNAVGESIWDIVVSEVMGNQLEQEDT